MLKNIARDKDRIKEKNEIKWNNEWKRTREKNDSYVRQEKVI